MESLEIKANAKINLALSVKHKRDDGYHEVELIFQEIDFYDRIFISRNDNIKFSTDSSLLRDESINLCVTAANL